MLVSPEKVCFKTGYQANFSSHVCLKLNSSLLKISRKKAFSRFLMLREDGVDLVAFFTLQIVPVQSAV